MSLSRPATPGPLAAKKSDTAAIPIVIVESAGDPLGSGLVASLARPGGNVTGMSLMAPDPRWETVGNSARNRARDFREWQSSGTSPTPIPDRVSGDGECRPAIGNSGLHIGRGPLHPMMSLVLFARPHGADPGALITVRRPAYRQSPQPAAGICSLVTASPQCTDCGSS